MNPLPFPPKVRVALYYVYGVGSLVATYLAAKGTVGADEMALWTGLGVLFGLTAAVNTNTTARRDERGVSDLAFIVGVALFVVLILVVLGR